MGSGGGESSANEGGNVAGWQYRSKDSIAQRSILCIYVRIDRRALLPSYSTVFQSMHWGGKRANLMETDRKKIIARLERDGWMNADGTKHDQFRHPARAGVI